MKRLQIRVRFAHGETAHITTKNIPNGDTRTPREVAAHIVEAYNHGAHDYAPLIASVVDIAEIEPETPESEGVKVLYYGPGELWKYNRYDHDWTPIEIQPIPGGLRVDYGPDQYEAHEKERNRLLGLPCPAGIKSVLSPDEEDDPVNHPAHYTAGGIEAIDYMKAKSTPEEFAGYLRLNALKYLSRANYKGKTLQDFKKSQWYVNRLVEEVSECDT